MKRLALASLLVVAISASFLEEQSASVHFQAFKLKHGKTYKTQVEETKRFTIFKENLQEISAHNARYEQGLETYKLGINKFADMTQQEFRAMLGAQRTSKPNLNITETFKMPEGVQVPDSIDWRQKNAVTNVKDQLLCSSCWAFAITGTVEGAYAVKSGTLVSLSEQQLVDCTTNINYGCKGGYLDKTFSYIIENGLQSESSYPYVGEDGTCNYQASSVVTSVNTYLAMYNDETELKNIVGTRGPVAVAINADVIHFYSSGIVTSKYCDPTGINHGVLVVGYGSENGVDYWIVKNSWGAAWGEDGYFRMILGKNECGIAAEPFFPLID